MMTFRRYLKMAALVAATVTLTACGGGDTGPQWAQDLKETLTPDDLQLPVGTYHSPCSRFTSGQTQSFIEINVIEKRGGAYHLTTTEEWYDDLGCSDTKKLFTLTYPKAQMTYVGTGEDSTASLTYKRVLLISEGGEMVITPVDGDAVTITPTPGSATQKRISFTNSESLAFDQLFVFPAGATNTDIFGRDQGSLYRGDPTSALVEVGDSSFQTKLGTNLPFRPYRFISITPGTYADGKATTPPSDPEEDYVPDCYTRTETGPDGDRDYGFITKVVVEPIGQDYRPQISLELEYFSDVDCTNRLVTIKLPPTRLETVGNGIDPTLGVAYRQVLQLQQAGTITATPTDDRVTVAGDVVRFVDDNVTIQIGAVPAETRLESMYFDDLTLYIGDQRSIDPATGFPTALGTEFPFFLLD